MSNYIIHAQNRGEIRCILIPVLKLAYDIAIWPTCYSGASCLSSFGVYKKNNSTKWRMRYVTLPMTHTQVAYINDNIYTMLSYLVWFIYVAFALELEQKKVIALEGTLCFLVICYPSTLVL